MMGWMEEEVEERLRLGLALFVGALLLCVIAFAVWSWLSDTPDPLREFQFQCEAAGGHPTRGVMMTEGTDALKHFSLCLPDDLVSGARQ
jgi:hypothetical protein